MTLPAMRRPGNMSQCQTGDILATNVLKIDGHSGEVVMR